MDFVTVWKIIAIALTGFFGILGLITEFKDKGTGQITKWGRLSLLGIVVSTVGGAAAQLKESSDQEVARANSARQSLAILENIQRSLSQIDEPIASMQFYILCNKEEFKAYCDELPRSQSRAEGPMAEAWKNFPTKMDGAPVLLIGLLFFRDDTLVERYLQHDNVDPNLEYTLSPTHSGFDPALKDSGSWKRPGVYFDGYKLDLKTNDGTFVSMRDFSGSTVLVKTFGAPCKPTWLAIDNKNLIRIDTGGIDPQFEEIANPAEYGASSLYRYKFRDAGR